MEHLEMKRKIAIMVAIMAAMLFASLNQTIIGTALPRIVADLGGIEYFNWVFTIFMLTSSVTAILVGKLSDIYGRKPFILIGLGVFFIGTFLCGLSASMVQLIIYRGIQGFGAGMIMSTSFTAVGDLFPPRERGRWQGLMSSVFGLSSVLGPTLGGYIVDYFDWHWVFWVFLPFGFVAFGLIWRLFPSVDRSGTEKVDYFGSLFLTLHMIPLMLAFSWAGTKFTWTSLQVLGLFAFSLTAFFLFIYVEKKASSPVLPLHLFKNNIFTVANLAGFVMGAGMFGAVMYMPFFVQGVMGKSAMASGFIMMPMMLSMMVTSALAGQIMSKRGTYKKLGVAGMMIMTAGMFSMSLMGQNTTSLVAVINVILVGAGLGIGFPVFTLSIQNAVEHKFLGVVTASAQLFRQLGGTIGVSVMGTVLSYLMAKKLNMLSNNNLMSVNNGQMDANVENMLSKLQNPQVLMDPDELAAIKSAIPPEYHQVFASMVEILKDALSYSLTGVFLTGSAVLFIAVVITFFLKEIPLRTKMDQETEPHPAPLPHSTGAGVGNK